MHPALVAAVRRMGCPCGSPNLEGLLYAVGADESRSSDMPPWLTVTRWLVLVPIACATIAAVVAARLVAGLLPGRERRRPASPLTYGLAGFLIGDFAAQRRRKPIQVWRLDTQQGARVLRVAIPPAHRSDVRVGDSLICWVRPLRDGTFAVDRADNLRTGERISPSQLSPALLFLAWASLLMFGLLVVATLVAHA